MVFSVVNWCFARPAGVLGLLFPWNTPENGKVIFPYRSNGYSARRTPQGQSDIQRDSFDSRMGHRTMPTCEHVTKECQSEKLWHSLFLAASEGTPQDKRGAKRFLTPLCQGTWPLWRYLLKRLERGAGEGRLLLSIQEANWVDGTEGLVPLPKLETPPARISEHPAPKSFHTVTDCLSHVLGMSGDGLQ